jgi:hypothetical protein
MAQAGQTRPRAERLTQEMKKTTMQLHDDQFLKILWDENSRIIRIDWKEATSSMTDEQFKAELALFAGHVEDEKAKGILVDVSCFQHTMGPDVQQWRVKNISSRYSAAGVERFAFLFPSSAHIPPMMNQSSMGEEFDTRAFTELDAAAKWLAGNE